MTTQTEALKLALDYIIATNKSSQFWLVPESNLNKTVTAIKEALAQPEQEPVGEAYLCDRCQTPFDGAYECPSCGHNEATKEPVYTTPPTQQSCSQCPSRSDIKPLTLGQKQRLWSSLGHKPTLKDRVNAYGSAIEAAHGIKGEA